MDGTNMPQSTANYTQADAQGWVSTIEALLDELEDAVADLKQAQPNNVKVERVRVAAATTHNGLRDLADAATSRLAPAVNTPLYSGGIDKPRKTE
jgi:hypothetical protein